MFSLTCCPYYRSKVRQWNKQETGSPSFTQLKRVQDDAKVGPSYCGWFSLWLVFTKQNEKKTLFINVLAEHIIDMSSQ